jgi:hypothetical protein
LTGLPGDRGRRKSKTKKSFAGHRRDGRVLDLQKEMVPEISSGIGDNPRPTHHIAETKKILTVKNLAGYRRAQQDEGQIRRGDVSYVDTKKASELLGRSGLQLPRVPSLNTGQEGF